MLSTRRPNDYVSTAQGLEARLDVPLLAELALPPRTTRDQSAGLHQLRPDPRACDRLFHLLQAEPFVVGVVGLGESGEEWPVAVGLAERAAAGGFAPVVLLGVEECHPGGESIQGLRRVASAVHKTLLDRVCPEGCGVRAAGIQGVFQAQSVMSDDTTDPPLEPGGLLLVGRADAFTNAPLTESLGGLLLVAPYRDVPDSAMREEVTTISAMGYAVLGMVAVTAADESPVESYVEPRVEPLVERHGGSDVEMLVESHVEMLGEMLVDDMEGGVMDKERPRESTTPEETTSSGPPVEEQPGADRADRSGGEQPDGEAAPTRWSESTEWVDEQSAEAAPREGMPEGVPEGMPEGVPEGALKGALEGVPEGVPEGALEGVPEGASEPEGATHGEGTSHVGSAREPQAETSGGGPADGGLAGGGPAGEASGEDAEMLAAAAGRVPVRRSWSDSFGPNGTHRRRRGFPWWAYLLFVLVAGTGSWLVYRAVSPSVEDPGMAMHEGGAAEEPSAWSTGEPIGAEEGVAPVYDGSASQSGGAQMTVSPDGPSGSTSSSSSALSGSATGGSATLSAGSASADPMMIAERESPESAGATRSAYDAGSSSNPGRSQADSQTDPRADPQTAAQTDSRAVVQVGSQPAAQAPTMTTERRPPYALLCGSFQQMSRAQSEVNRLARLGVDARIQRVDIPAKGVWHRVLVGDFTTLESAYARRSEALEENWARSVLLVADDGRGTVIVPADD